MKRTTLTHADMTVGKINPRKSMDPEALKELAATIATSGLGQNLVVWPIPGAKKAPQYEIVAGQRRHAAIALLMAEGKFAADTPIPVEVIEGDESEARAFALVENLQREDMNPVDQANGFAELEKAGWDTGRIAKALGKTDQDGNASRSGMRFVQQRLALIKKLDKDVLEKVRTGAINFKAARQLSQIPDKKLQKDAAGALASGEIETFDHLQEYLTEDNPPLNWAIFDRALYTGEIIEDPDDETKGWFADAKQAEKLQRKAIDDLIAEQKKPEKGNAFVLVCDQSKPNQPYLYSHDFRPAPKGAKNTGFFMKVTSHLGVEIKENCIDTRTKDEARTSAPAATSSKGGKAAAPAPRKPGDMVTKSHLYNANIRRTRVVQEAIAADPDWAKRMVILALMGGTKCVDIMAEPSFREETTIAPKVAQALKDAAPGLGAKFEAEGTHPLSIGVTHYEQRAAKQASAIAVLAKMKGAALDRLFGAIVAAKCGIFQTFRPEPGVGVAGLALAQALGLVGNEAKHGLGVADANDIAGIKGVAFDGLRAQLQVAPGKTVKETTVGLTTAAIAAKTVLPTFAFLDHREAEAGIAALMKASAKKAPAKKIAAGAKAPTKKTAPAAKKTTTKKTPAKANPRRAIPKAKAKATAPAAKASTKKKAA